MSVAPGTLGGMIGLVFGLAQYVSIFRMIERSLNLEIAQTPDASGAAKVTQRLKNIKLVLLVHAFLIMPATGYFVGMTIGA